MARAADARPHGFVRAGRVLDQQHQHTPIAHGDSLEAPERCTERLQPGNDLLQRGAERERERRGRKRVVHVVETGNPQLDSALPGLRREGEADGLQPVQLELSRRDVERRAAVPAGRTAVVAEVSNVRRCILIGGSAANAVLRVRRMLQRGARDPRIVEPEHDGARTLARELPDLRIVAGTPTGPSGSRAASRSIAPGSIFHSSLPGTVVPPPAPARRESRPAACATATSAARGRGRRKTEGGYPRRTNPSDGGTSALLPQKGEEARRLPLYVAVRRLR